MFPLAEDADADDAAAAAAAAAPRGGGTAGVSLRLNFPCHEHRETRQGQEMT